MIGKTKPVDCICGSESGVAEGAVGHYCVCSLDRCGMVGPELQTEEAAIKVWNREIEILMPYRDEILPEGLI